ncbi:hypothetical protein [Ottowia testudinis]|uniref:Uncharacterized protein n=1 Tax=Ottowia testudinis TaxID=2816950 RepID=A0A975CN27_9BURK|nr:hypothetical protein [Ottowia testudinis]QTD46513.1 hypothetical protein J1M35_06430 [Ottowia testudinis]
MAVSTTFGYNAPEDRLWLACAAWPQRLWLTRRVVRAMLQAVVQSLESAAAAAPLPAGDTRPAAERAAAAHDASLNQPQPGEQVRALQMGREATDAPALQGAVLCTRFTLLTLGTQTELVFDTPAGQRRLRLSRIGLHRWLHALQLVLRSAGWTDWPAAPDWLTRSYLPPALRSLLTPPPADSALDDEPYDDVP